MIEGRAPTAPRGITWLAVVAVGALMIAYFEALHEIARAMAGGFGSPASVVCLAVAATTVGSLPLLALIPITRLPAWWWGERVPFVRAQRGQCPDCGYSAPRYPCPECGGDGNLALRPLIVGLEVGWVLRIVVVTLVIGITCAEWRVRHDESRFIEEVRMLAPAGPVHRERPRAGWGHFTNLEYDSADGFRAPAPFTMRLIPGLRQNDRAVRP